MKQLSSMGKPVVLVIISGRPRLLHGAADASNAVLGAFQPGPMGGLAIAEVMFGRFSPSGRMPFSYPKNAANLLQYHHKPSDKCTSASNPYNYVNCEVIFFVMMH